jgi:hypothetical protein
MEVLLWVCGDVGPTSTTAAGTATSNSKPTSVPPSPVPTRTQSLPTALDEHSQLLDNVQDDGGAISLDDGSV